jgi:large subunit ribosomal protein L19
MDVSQLLDIKKNAKIPDIAPGDTVRVSTKIVEGDKERIQVFQGVVIKIKRGGAGASYTVRHIAFGIGVERTFPLSSPMVEKVEIVRQGKVRRARLYYLRGLSGKEARRKIKRVERKARQVGDELLQEQPEEVIEPIMDEAAVAAAAEKAAAEKAAAEAAAAKAPEAAKEKKETAAEKPKGKAPAAEKKETAEKPSKEDKPAKPAKDEKKEEPKA